MSFPTVAVVSPVPFGEEGLYGGGERYAFELARALSHITATRLVTFSNQLLPSSNGLDVRSFRPITYIHGSRQNPFSIGFLGALKDVDVIHCVSWNTLVTDLSVLYARWKRKRVFVTDVGGGGSFSLQNKLSLGAKVDGFLLIAEQGGRQFDAHRSRWSIILCGVDTEKYSPGLSESPRDGVLFVGRLLPHKGVNYLIEALDHRTRLRVVGRVYHQEYFEMLQQMSRGKDVEFITHASDDQIVNFYRTCSVAVLPSVEKTIYGSYFALPEYLGLAPMEAMACGAPVVCTDVGAMSQLVVDGVTGFLVPPNDPRSLAEKIHFLLHNPKTAASMGIAGRNRILEFFTWDNVARKCLKAYEPVSLK